MSQRYTHENRAWVKRTLSALLPEGVTADVSLLRDGWQMQVTVCGPKSCHPYEFAPGLTELHLIRLAEQWKTGDRVPPPHDDKATPEALGSMVDTADELRAWARSSKKGQRVIYFTGNLAQFRADTAKAVVTLQAKGDEKISGNGLSAAERVKLTSMQGKLSLLEAVNTLQVASMIELTQARLTDGQGFIYYAVKR